VFTNAGKAYVAAKLDGTNTNPPHFIGWGTGTTTAAAADTVIQTESAETRAVGAKSRVTTTVTNDTFQVVGTLTSLSGQTIGNVGVLDASTSGILVIHADHTGLPLLTGDSIQYTVQLKFA
jgi:hypothetical protein